MAKTPYKDLSSDNILSAHLSGLQHDINKLQDILNLQTGVKTNQALTPVVDQDNPALRYRIYEGNIRNWLNVPAPVIYRNGTVVPQNEYEIQPAYGVIVFGNQQNASDAITVDFTHIVSESKVVTDITNEIESIQQTLNDIGDGEDLPANYNILGGVAPFYEMSGSYLSHQKRDYDPVIYDGSNPVYDSSTHYPAFNILVYGDTLDVFPFPVTQETTFSKAGIMLGDNNSSNVNVKIGLYKDNGKGYPGELVFQSPNISVSPGSWGYANIDETILPGLYWIARHDGGTARWNGLDESSVIHIRKFNGETFLRNLAERPNPHQTAGGYRATGITFGNLPGTFPSGIEPFKRNFYCSPWLITE